MNSLDLHPFDPIVTRDPYPWYEALRREHPVAHLSSVDLWVVTGHDEVTAVLHDPTTFSSQLGYRALGGGYLRGGQATNDLFGVDMNSMRMLISTDPPAHTRIRRLLSRAFTPRAVTALDPRLREVCAEMVGDVVANLRTDDADLMRDLAMPFPVAVIAELLGVPSDRRDDFRRWSDVMSSGLSGDVDLEALATVGIELFGFMNDVVEQRRRQPADDLVSRLVVGADDDDDPLTLEEITLIAILLLAAGNETTTNLLGNSFAALAAHPDQAERVWRDPSLVPALIEEVLRWDSPVQCLLRGTTQPTTLSGVDLPEHAVVLISFAGANRDPARFDDADRFDIGRTSNEHLAFGHGIHFCLGATLARHEAQVAFEALIAAGVEMRPSPRAVRTENLFLRGFTSFPLDPLGE